MQSCPLEKPALQRRLRVPGGRAPAARLLHGARITYRRWVSCSQEKTVSCLVPLRIAACTVGNSAPWVTQVLHRPVGGGGLPDRVGAGSSPGHGVPQSGLKFRAVCVVPVCP